MLSTPTGRAVTVLLMLVVGFCVTLVTLSDPEMRDCALATGGWLAGQIAEVGARTIDSIRR